MATNTFIGIATTIDPTTGDITSATGGSFGFVGPDSITDFSYRIITPASSTQLLPEIEFTGPSLYGMVADGVPVPTAALAGATVYIGEINWSTGNTTYFF